MFLKSLRLQNFRNFTEEKISFASTVNQIEGDNAQGKTNILEAIYLLATGRSFRTPHLIDLIQNGEKQFFLEVEFVKDDVPQHLRLFYSKEKRQMQINDTIYPTFTHLLGLIPAVIYAPEDISLISGEPALRRHFLDLFLAQSDLLYIHHLIRYAKALKQRNALLKQKSDAAINAWEESMALSATYIVNKRQEAVEELSEESGKVMLELSGGLDTLSLRYRPSLSEDFIEQYAKWREREMLIGTSLIGPHRDELFILVNDKEAKRFASAGQKRSAIAAIRLAEWQRLSILTNVQPLLSIDDFGVHLDDNRIELLQAQVQKSGQVFLTSPQFSDQTPYTLSVKGGRVHKEVQ